LSIFDPLVPISTLLTTVGLVISVEVIILGFRTLKWILSHVPLVGGKG